MGQHPKDRAGGLKLFPAQAHGLQERVLLLALPNCPALIAVRIRIVPSWTAS
ncbi:hypothetical protein [Paracoccus benzoatiresistens]|uniref:Uncharacterized protein n=1 Tax=Paracoccus benzoatiresistens TaxID=2997341 RepID=A0ABT4J8A7_9RHOB|nr:hypothetical protein [Paracoccus sp. EF6]MCZ0963366.1 hypothetical protein [Paracoccus sp. EF6]